MASGIGLQSLGMVSTSAGAPIVRQDAQESASTDGWTPPQWARSGQALITVPATTTYAQNPSSASGTMSAEGTYTVNASVIGTAATVYIFDNPAVLKSGHQRMLRKTQNPVLTGANIADHAYIEPARVTLEILASDAMATLQGSEWSGFTELGVAVWQVFKSLQQNRTLVTLTTRLDTYSNMLVEQISTNDDNKTQHGLRATIVLSEIIAGGVASQQSASARPDATDSTQGGTVTSIPIDPAMLQQLVVPSAQYPDVQTYPQIPGAGTVSSNSLGQSPTK